MQNNHIYSSWNMKYRICMTPWQTAHTETLLIPFHLSPKLMAQLLITWSSHSKNRIINPTLPPTFTWPKGLDIPSRKAHLDVNDSMSNMNNERQTGRKPSSVEQDTTSYYQNPKHPLLPLFLELMPLIYRFLNSVLWHPDISTLCNDLKSQVL